SSASSRFPTSRRLCACCGARRRTTTVAPRRGCRASRSTPPRRVPARPEPTSSSPLPAGERGEDRGLVLGRSVVEAELRAVEQDPDRFLDERLRLRPGRQVGDEALALLRPRGAAQHGEEKALHPLLPRL